MVATVVTPARTIASEKATACHRQRVKFARVLANIRAVPMLKALAPPSPRLRRTGCNAISNIVRDTNTDVNTLASNPIASVVAKPRMALVPNWNRKAAAMSDVTCVSTSVNHTRVKAAFTAARGVAAAASSSLIRSKINTLESTPMPMVKINPAMPGSVSVTGM